MWDWQACSGGCYSGISGRLRGAGCLKEGSEMMRLGRQGSGQSEVKPAAGHRLQLKASDPAAAEEERRLQAPGQARPAAGKG